MRRRKKERVVVAKNVLSLTVEIELGASIDEAVRQACQLASMMRMASVEFDGNDKHYVCFADFKAIRYNRLDLAGVERCDDVNVVNVVSELVWTGAGKK